MSREAAAFLRDVLKACDAIERFIDDIDETDYAENELIQSAVERKFEIIGEALNQLSKIRPDLTDRVRRLREIIAFRNILIHGYASIRQDRVWSIAHLSLPALRADIELLVDELRDTAG